MLEMQRRARKEPGKKKRPEKKACGVLAPGQGLHCAMSVRRATGGEACGVLLLFLLTAL